MIDSGGPVPSTSSSNSSTKTTAIPMQARLLKEGQLERLHRKQTPRLNGKLIPIVGAFKNNGDLSTTKLLKKCLELYVIIM